MNLTAEAVLAKADGEVGFFTPGPPRNSKYGAWYGVNPGPYCAMFLSWCHAEVGQSHLVAASSSKGYAYTPAGAAWFQRRGQWGQAPRIGAHVFFQFSGPRIHHVGIVVDVNGDGSIDTVEGNTACTASGDQRDGGAVCRKVRRSGIVGYGYPVYGPGGVPGGRRRMFMYWHFQAVYLCDGLHRSRHGLHPHVIGDYQGAGVPIHGKAGDNRTALHDYLIPLP
ncbi:MAG: CHAP domain-containing protein [Actinomycetota bacterium]|nr:CHAP domain-containing protein [Actinomycetota bacterium]